MKKKIKTHVVYAASDKKKIRDIGKHFDPHGISLSSLRDFVPVDLEIEDCGEALGEYAILTSFAYARELSECVKPDLQFVVLSEDSSHVVHKTIIAVIHVAPDGMISEPHLFEGALPKKDKKVSIDDHRTLAVKKAVPFIKAYF